MRICYALLLLLMPAGIVFAQTALYRPKNPVCVLPVGPFEGTLYVPPPTINYLSEFEKSATFIINYVPNGTNYNGQTCLTWPAQAQTAMAYAANIWGSLLTSSQTITINACWSSSLGVNTLGVSGPTSFAQLTPPPAWYALPMAEAILGSNFGNPFPTTEIDSYFNNTRSDWYFGTDGAPAGNQVDFVTTALHELGHGLGFIGVAGLDNGAGAVECDGVNGHGCLGFESSGTFTPTSYCLDVETDNNVSALSIGNPSSNLGTLLTGGSLSGGAGGLYAGGINLMAANGNAPAKLYTPATFTPGSSYSHFDLASYPGQLMKPSLSFGQAIHDPGLALQVLEDQGWPLADPLPVTLTTFRGEKRPDDILLTWVTATELNNSGFEVQRSSDGVNWETLEWVAGNGTSYDVTTYHRTDRRPMPGVNYYRLVQYDYDGGLFKTDAIAISWPSPEQQVTAWPNPAQEYVWLNWPEMNGSVGTAQVLDGLGKVILEEKISGPNHQLSLTNLPGGMYTIVLFSERNIQYIPLIKQAP